MRGGEEDSESQLQPCNPLHHRTDSIAAAAAAIASPHRCRNPHGRRRYPPPSLRLGSPFVPRCELLGFPSPSPSPVRVPPLPPPLQRGAGGRWGRRAPRASPPNGSRRKAGRQGHQMEQRPAARGPRPRQGQGLPFLASQGPAYTPPLPAT